MATPNPSAFYNDIFTLTLENRVPGMIDLVTSQNAWLTLLREEGMFKTFTGPTIRVKFNYNLGDTYTRYTGYQQYRVAPEQYFTEAVHNPKQAAVTMSLSGTEVLLNSGQNQIEDIIRATLSVKEKELQESFNIDAHSAGLLANQVTGLAGMVPTVNTSGTYGGISRADFPAFRAGAYDVNNAASTLNLPGVTQVTKDNISSILGRALNAHVRGIDAPSLAMMDINHYETFYESLTDIQRVTNAQGELATKGFSSLRYAGVGRQLEVVLEGYRDSVMPANTTYLIDPKSMCFYYHPDRNFAPFGESQRPIGQDAIVQAVGFMGQFVMENPIPNAVIFDSNPAA